MPTKKLKFEHVKYFEVTAISAERAKAFVRRSDDPVDLGPSSRYPGSRRWGFPITGKTHLQTSH